MDATEAEHAHGSSDRRVNAHLGSQIWLERDLTREQVGELVDRAADVGFGQLRVFLMWPWIQSESPDRWDFELFDAVFDGAAEHGIAIKATLTANSGPWWLGTGSVLHSQTMTLDPSFRPRMEAYIAACVKRYANHPALGQWILWNEPMNPPENPWGDTFVTAEARDLWPHVLREKYQDIAGLNTRWRTGYASFDEVPMANDVMHPAHHNNTWRSFGPILSDYELRSRIIENELGWIADKVRENDPSTPLCANPCQSLYNHAEAGYNLQNIGKVVDVLGATFHAPWSFGFAKRRHPLGPHHRRPESAAERAGSAGRGSHRSADREHALRRSYAARCHTVADRRDLPGSRSRRRAIGHGLVLQHQGARLRSG